MKSTTVVMELSRSTLTTLVKADTWNTWRVYSGQQGNLNLFGVSDLLSLTKQITAKSPLKFP